MSIDEFLERLKRTPRDWELRAFNPGQPCRLIRRGFPWQCPISSLADASAATYWDVAQDLGFSGEDAGIITNAADKDELASPFHTNADRVRQNGLRARILEAVGLSEKGDRI